MIQKKRVLLTGISGSIGVHVMIHIFHNTDWDIVGIASYKHKGLAERITEMLREHPAYWDRLSLITHDLSKPITPRVSKRIGHVDYIINLAALSDVELSIQEPASFIRNNVDIAINVLEFAREVKPEVVIQISTDEVYGAAGKDAAHTEWFPTVPSNPYSASKACQEAIAIAYWRTYNVPVVITNTMNNFGEMQQGSKYPVIIQKLIENDESVTIHGRPGDVGSRYYLHSRNHADALVFIIKNLPPYLHKTGEIDRPDRYNIAGDQQVDNLELAQIIAGFLGKELKYTFVDFHATRPGHDRHYGLDGTKLKELGWKPPMSFRESLKNTIEWQKDHDEWINL